MNKVSRVVNLLVAKSLRVLKNFERLSLASLLIMEPLPDVILSIVSKFGLKLENLIFPIYVNGISAPIYMRYKSSDPIVARQIFVYEEYLPLSDIKNPRLIIDCGANVGYSSVYFLNQFPSCYVISVEPDPQNLAICRKNLESYAGRVSLICAGIWSHPASLKLQQTGIGNEYGVRVYECTSDETADVLATDVDTLLLNSQFDSIDILKIDIEGSEKIVFSKNYKDWLSKVHNIAIELHDDDDKKVFFNALSQYECEVLRSGELTICKNMRLGSNLVSSEI